MFTGINPARLDMVYISMHTWDCAASIGYPQSGINGRREHFRYPGHCVVSIYVHQVHMIGVCRLIDVPREAGCSLTGDQGGTAAGNGDN